ncbi:ABC transporter permease [Acetanaerobacterium elongatum]|uniref:Autoinducer 2 import system permease protein LsrC n=1 Tax=Acetanaerobacterium elongatum TaxID=258515 RepID=A0A1H0FCX4_9FIRM|nr:ABC transporter permease [Acetanaerobacterium elongatum]SDN92548.1 monosaccharide ABC transporter membrane protein, CUT2 family [Acetanaerobacterium elongatum]
MKKTLQKLLHGREISAVGFLIAMFLVAGLVNPEFLAPDNLLLTLNGSVMYILLAVGSSFVIVTSDIDVSIGANLGLTGAMAATLIRDGVSLMIVIPATLLLGAAIGLINGIGVAKLNVPAIIMTLGTNGIIRGFIYIYTKGKWVENLPDFFKQYSQLTLIGFVNVFLLITAIIVTLVYLYLSKAKKGKYFAAIGDNVSGAALIGIPVPRTRMIAFVLSGTFAALAGLVFVSKVGFVSPMAGNGYEMKAIAACVLGGVSLSGGMGSVIGASIGAIIMSSISRILVFLKFPSDWDNTITGILLIVIVVADALIQRHLSEKARKTRLSARTSAQKEAAV